jgi:hypothetical protein
MRIATIVQGEYRSMDIATKSWNFKDQCDFYVHTWSESKVKNSDRIIYVNEEMIHELLPNVKSIKISDFRKTFNVECEQDILTCDIIIYNLVNSFKLLLESGNEYDYVIIARPDTPIVFDRPLQEFVIKNDRLYGNGTKLEDEYDTNASEQRKIDYTEQCTDLFYVGSFDVLKKIFETIGDDYLDLKNLDLKTKKHFALFVLEAGYFIEPLPYLINFGILRNNGHFLNFPNGFHFRELSGEEWNHFLGIDEHGNPITQR